MNAKSHGLIILVSIPLAFLCMLNLHEIGHTVFARLSGDGEAVYYLYQRFPNGGFCMGCNIYDESKLSTGLVVASVVYVWWIARLAQTRPIAGAA